MWPLYVLVLICQGFSFDYRLVLFSYS